MKAVQMHEFGSESVLRYEDIPRPEPQSGEVLVRVAATSVNALDVKLREGALRGFMDFPLPLPLILGCDVAGTVEATGEGVTDFRPGDRVFGMPAKEVGMYAEYVVLQAPELARLPEALDFDSAASLPTVALTAWQGLFDIGGLKQGQSVLVHGASGGVGSLAVQLAKWKGCRVVATASTEKVSFVRDLGADQVIDYKQKRFEDQAHDMDMVLDVLSGETRERSWQTLKRDGVLVSTVPPFPAETDGQPLGVSGKGFGVHPQADQLEEIARLVVAGILKAAVAKVLPLAEAGEGHRLLKSGAVSGKVVLHVGDSK